MRPDRDSIKERRSIEMEKKDHKRGSGNLMALRLEISVPSGASLPKDSRGLTSLPIRRNLSACALCRQRREADAVQSVGVNMRRSLHRSDRQRDHERTAKLIEPVTTQNRRITNILDTLSATGIRSGTRRQRSYLDIVRPAVARQRKRGRLFWTASEVQ